MKSEDAIVFTLTNSYTAALKVFFKSYLYFKNKIIKAVIFEEEPITEENKNALMAIYPNICFKNFSMQVPYVANRKREWKINPFNRFEIFTLDYDKIIFFDTDMLVLSNIDSLFDLSVSFGAVYHKYPDGVDSDILNETFTYNNKQFNFMKSFNAGLMVISKQYLSRKVYEELVKISTSYKWLGNQGPINVFFNDKVSLLDDNYFVTTPEITSNLFKNAKILHFAGEVKPWLNNNYDLKDNFNHHVLETVEDRTVLLKCLYKYKKFLKEI